MKVTLLIGVGFLLAGTLYVRHIISIDTAKAAAQQQLSDDVATTSKALDESIADGELIVSMKAARKKHFGTVRDIEYSYFALERKIINDQYLRDLSSQGHSRALEADRDRQLDRVQAKQDKADATYEKGIKGE